MAPQPLTNFALSADGTLVAGGGSAAPAERPKTSVWNARTGALVTTLSGDATGQSAVAFSPKGLIAVASDDAQMITLFDAKTFQKVGSLGGVDGVVGRILRFNHDGSRLLSGSVRGARSMLWNVDTRRPAWPHRVADTELYTANIDRQNTVLYSNRFGKVVRIEEATAVPAPSQVSLQGGSICDLELSPDGAMVAEAACNEATVGLFSLDGHATIGPIAAREQLGGYSADGSLLWTFSDRAITIRDARTFAPKWRAPFHRSAGLTNDGKYLLVIRPDGRGGLYDFRAGRFAFSPIPIPHPDQISQTALNPANGDLALGYDDGTVIVYDHNGRVTAPKGIRVGNDNNGRSVHGIAFTPDGKWMAVAAQDERTVIFDTATGRPVAPPIPRRRTSPSAPTASCSPPRRSTARPRSIRFPVSFGPGRRGREAGRGRSR